MEPSPSSDGSVRSSSPIAVKEERVRSPSARSHTAPDPFCIARLATHRGSSVYAMLGDIGVRAEGLLPHTTLKHIVKYRLLGGKLGEDEDAMEAAAAVEAGGAGGVGLPPGGDEANPVSPVWPGHHSDPMHPTTPLSPKAFTLGGGSAYLGL